MKLSNLHKMERLRAQAAAIESEWALHKRALLSLPNKLGYRSIKDLVKGLELVDKGDKVARSSHRKTASRKRRVTISEATKRQVRQLVSEGRTGREIARSLNISVASIQKIKAELGLTRKRRPNK